ncbi:hypothetical protein [Rhizobium sp. FKY42]|uniref:hypothetical protein n=1 Tax=Rhizobium sp. FKY42 TaxID=2562310 RepID=UPI0010BFAAFD|nr:hypothetical protein [Rhizobium sp. FKY42]
MSIRSDKFEETLAELQKYDGKLWLRILGQTHWQYNELPFWVLMKDREQIKDAFPVLQKILRPLQDDPDADITVSFITFAGDQDCSHGYYKGMEFFEENAIDEIYEEPGCRPREPHLFDHAYPNDPWAMKDARFPQLYTKE